MNKSNAQSESVYAAVGRSLGAFTRIEMALSELYLTLNDGFRQWSFPQQAHPLSAAFDGIQSFKTRLEIVNNFVATDPRLDGKFKAAWHTLYNNLNAQSDKRNEIGHFAIIHRLTQKSDGSDVHEYLVQPYFAVSKVLKNKLRTPLRLSDLQAMEASFLKTRDRLLNLSRYLHAIRSNAEGVGQPITDLDHLLGA